MISVPLDLFENIKSRVECVNGAVFYRDRATDQLHRTDGPAVIYANGDHYWFLHGQLHRADGPAMEYANGGRWWYWHGQHMTEQEHAAATARKASPLL